MVSTNEMTDQEQMEAEAIINALVWTKSSPNGKYKDMPHEYAWRASQRWNEDKQRRLATLIEKYGVVEPFFRTFYAYLYIGDYKYWLCGTVAEDNFLINRCDKDRHYD